MTRIALLFAAAVAFAADPPPWQKDAQALLDGVKEIAGPGSPGTLAVWGKGAFPVVVGGAPVVAAARLGRGRLVAFAHDGFIGAAGDRDTGRLLSNAVCWVAGGVAKPRVGALGCSYADARACDGDRLADDLASLDVLVCTEADLSRAEVRAIETWVGSGHGLLVAYTGWGWLQLHPGKSIRDLPLNPILAGAGLSFADGFAHETAKDGFVAGEVPGLAFHALCAIDAVAGGAAWSGDDLAQATATILAAVRTMPPEERAFRGRIDALLEKRGGAIVPTEQEPLGKDAALDRLLLAYQIELSKALPRDKVRAHPSAATFPGVPEAGATAVERDVDVDTSVPDWHGTGLWAPAGRVVRIDVDAVAQYVGLSVRIGCHSDSLDHLDVWPRAPEIDAVFPITDMVTEVASAFGGLLYVVVPRGCKAGRVTVKIAGAMEAPRFVLGATEAAEWKSSRSAPAPWAELEATKVVLTVPSTCVRDLDDPTALLRFWDGVLDAAADLAGIPHDRERPERYVADVEISAGYMHSGYPIMVHLDAAPRMTSLETMRKGDWGLFHELGHNHQAAEWTFEGTGEVTNNLWSLYLLETCCGAKPGEGHEALADRAAKARAHVAAGADFEAWKSDPFLALTMYVQLREAFGWEPFKRVFLEYRSLPPDGRPATDDAKRDEWMRRMSRAVGRDLGPFFEAWGVPTSQAARDAVHGLPAWMPDGLR